MDMESSTPLLNEVIKLGDQIWSALNAAETRLVQWGKTQELLSYQVEQLDIHPLWKNVRQQRTRTLAVRQTVFSAPPDTHPRPGTATRQHFRVQNTLNSGEQRLVDWLGRTESEAEEESAIPQEELGQPPPFQELQAWAAATAPAKEHKKQTKKWWWFFNQKAYGSEDETIVTQSVTNVDGER